MRLCGWHQSIIMHQCGLETATELLQCIIIDCHNRSMPQQHKMIDRSITSSPNQWHRSITNNRRAHHFGNPVVLVRGLAEEHVENESRKAVEHRHDADKHVELRLRCVIAIDDGETVIVDAGAGDLVGSVDAAITSGWGQSSPGVFQRRHLLEWIDDIDDQRLRGVVAFEWKLAVRGETCGQGKSENR